MTIKDAIKQLNGMAVTERDYEAVEMATEAMMRGEWVSVNDRLPEKDGKYLCVFESVLFNQYICTIQYSVNREKVDKDDMHVCGAGFYDLDGEGGYIAYDTVTHWMPMPQPPKEES